MTHIGTGFIILSFMILAGSSGSFNFSTFNAAATALSPGLKDAVFLFALIGFGTKAGIVPLHIWLPYAHPAAPSNVSALMSGVMIKTAIFMLIRVFFDFLGAGVAWWGMLVLILASVSALLGVLYALMEHDMKRLLQVVPIIVPSWKLSNILLILCRSYQSHIRQINRATRTIPPI